MSSNSPWGSPGGSSGGNGSGQRPPPGGGGPWGPGGGGGPGGPFGGRPGPGGMGPIPDLDQLIRRMQLFVRSIIGGRGPGSRFTGGRGLALPQQ